MATDTLPVDPRRIGDDDGRPHRIAQPDQIVRQRLAAVKALDLILKRPQLAHRTRQPSRRAHQPHIVPHDLLQSAHVLADQSRVGRAVLRVTPFRNVIGVV